jgi:hypothetical protein
MWRNWTHFYLGILAGMFIGAAFLYFILNGTGWISRPLPEGDVLVADGSTLGYTDQKIDGGTGNMNIAGDVTQSEAEHSNLGSFRIWQDQPPPTAPVGMIYFNITTDSGQTFQFAIWEKPRP